MPPCCRRMWSGELTPSSVAQELRTVAPSLASMAKYFNTFLSTATESLPTAQTKQNAGSSVHAVLSNTAERAPSATTLLRSASPACAQSRHCNASGMHQELSAFALACRRPAWLAQCVSALAGHRPPVPPVSHLLPACCTPGARAEPTFFRRTAASHLIGLQSSPRRLPPCRLAPPGLPSLDRSRMTPRAPVRNAHAPFAQSPGDPVGRPSLTLQPETPVGHPSPPQAGTGHGQAAACPRPIYSDKLPDKPPAQALTLSSSGRARPMLQGAESRF